MKSSLLKGGTEPGFLLKETKLPRNLHISPSVLGFLVCVPESEHHIIFTSLLSSF